MTQQKKKFNIFYWISFIVATIAITEFFTAYKFFSDDPSKAWSVIAVSLMVFLLALGHLAYSIYVEEKEKDNLRAEFEPFEKIYRALKG